MKRKIVRLATLMLALTLLLGLMPASAASIIKVNDINIMVNNRIFQPLDAAGQPVRVFEYNGTTYAPLRALAEAYGLNVGYSDSLRCAYVFEDVEPDLSGVNASDAAEIVPVETSGQTSLIVKPINIVVNGSVFKPTDVNGNPVAVFETGGTTYAPLRALAEAYGLVVGYNAERRLAYVTREGETPAFTTLADGSTLIAAEIPREAPMRSYADDDGWTIPDYESFAEDGAAPNDLNSLTGLSGATTKNRYRAEEYIALLQNEFGFEIVQDDLGYGIDTWWLDRPNDDVEMGDYGDIMVKLWYGNGNFTRVDVELYNEEFRFADMGHRWSGYGRTETVAGERATDMYVLKDGYYSNASDGLLSVKAGEWTETHIYDQTVKKDIIVHRGQGTVIVNNSEVITFEALLGNVYYSGDKIWVNNEDGDSVFVVGWREGTIGSNDLLLHEDFIYHGAGVQFRVGKYEFTEGFINEVTVRPLWLDRSGATESLIYFYFDIGNTDQNYVLEGLIAARFNLVETCEEYVKPAPDPAADPNAIKLKVGERKELEYDKPYVFMPNYETFDWYLKSGEGIVEIISTSSDSCIIEAKAPGTATVTCHYQYGTDEPDVLTGIPMNENHSRSHTFTIVVE